nr:hypothetical protein [Tanacetum cinerariifolium]
MLWPPPHHAHQHQVTNTTFIISTAPSSSPLPCNTIPLRQHQIHHYLPTATSPPPSYHHHSHPHHHLVTTIMTTSSLSSSSSEHPRHLLRATSIVATTSRYHNHHRVVFITALRGCVWIWVQHQRFVWFNRSDKGAFGF